MVACTAILELTGQISKRTKLLSRLSWQWKKTCCPLGHPQAASTSTVSKALSIHPVLVV